jgi:hypothetical protein
MKPARPASGTDNAPRNGNTSITAFALTPKRYIRLVTCNTLPHLDAAEHASWVTYA